tara:strand:- start:8821 stop:9039 length:219 start_codon:yes stop_codon:yes gene_type:complete
MPESITLYGPPDKKLEAKYKRWGYRKVVFEPRPSHDTGIGPCGKFQCSCENDCREPQEIKTILESGWDTGYP